MPNQGIEGDFSDKLERIVDRVTALENRQSVTIGKFRLRVVNGNLVAENVTTGTTTVVANG